MDDALARVLARFDGVQAQAKGYAARCPAHADDRASLSIALGEDGRVLLYCHAGCTVAAICAAMGVGLGELFGRWRPGSPRRVVATYDYRDASGAFLYQVVRSEPKSFRQRRPDGHGGWIWKLGDTPRVLYRLPELVAAPLDTWVFIVEGEKDVDNLVQRGLIATTCPQGAGKWSKLADDAALDGRRVAIIGDRDTAGRRHAADVAQRLHGRVAELRVLELPGAGKDASDWLAAGGTPEALLQLVAATAAYEPPMPGNSALGEPPPGSPPVVCDDRELPEVLIDHLEHRVVQEALRALRADPDLYQRGNALARIVPSRAPSDERAPTIDVVPPGNLRERLTRWVRFVRRNAQGEFVPAHPPEWLTAALAARGDWPELRSLRGVTDTPVLRLDGSLWQTPGYDAATGVLYVPPAPLPMIPDELDFAAAQRAADELLEVVCDFRFEAPAHRAAWLAAVLTPLARFVIAGPTPLTLIDANVRGAGKSLLAQTIGEIVLGHELPVSSYSHDPTELRKKLTAVALSGARLVLFDNVLGEFGNASLDRALTSTRWRDRVLGKSQEVDLPLTTVWLATGNNVQLAADTARRIIGIRLDVLDERPETRTGFRQPELIRWIRAHRGRLVSAGLTIVAAYCRAGRPPQKVPAFGSFEAWSALVRGAVIWLGLPDPCETQALLDESADASKAALAQLLSAWEEAIPAGRSIPAHELLQRAYAPPGGVWDAAAQTGLRAAIENFVGGARGERPAPVSSAPGCASTAGG
ncbi:MAG: hypothetical protein AB7Q17_12430 [Phycisphaerae bacterium]